MMTGDAAATPSRRWRWETLTGGGAVLQEDAFRRLWLGRLFSLTALNAVLYTLLVLAVGDGNGASIKSALFITAYLLPTATLGTFSGVLVDRLPKNLVLMGVSAARFGLMLMLLMSATSLWTVYGVALLIAMTSQFSGPAEAAALPQVVRSDQFTVANSTNNFGGLIAQVVGFAVLAPLFLNTVGPRPLFFVSGILFAVAGGFFITIHTLGSLRVDMDETVDAVRDVRKQFAEAWQILSRDVAAYMCVIMVVLSGTASLVAATLMPRFTQDILDVPVKNAIYLYLPATLGIVAGLRTVHLFERRLPRGALVGGGFALLMAALVCLALTKTIAAGLSGMTGLDVTPARIATAICFSTIAAFATPVIGIASRSLVNERVPMGIQGRVFAAQTVLGNLASIPPILFAGVLSELVGVAPVMLLTVVILICAAGWTLAQAVSRPRELDDATAA
jgi:MFS family permease